MSKPSCNFRAQVRCTARRYPVHPPASARKKSFPWGLEEEKLFIVHTKKMCIVSELRLPRWACDDFA